MNIGDMSNGNDDSGIANNNNGSSVDSKALNNCNLIINYLPQSLKEHDFNALFSRIGQLKSCKLMYERSTGKAKNNSFTHNVYT